MPALRVYWVPVSEPACGEFATSEPPDLTWIDQSALVAVPPSSLTTVLMTVSFGAMSSLVSVHVLFSPAARVTEPVLPQSPLKPVKEYPEGPPDSLTTYVPAGIV